MNSPCLNRQPESCITLIGCAVIAGGKREYGIIHVAGENEPEFIEEWGYYVCGRKAPDGEWFALNGMTYPTMCSAAEGALPLFRDLGKVYDSAPFPLAGNQPALFNVRSPNQTNLLAGVTS